MNRSSLYGVSQNSLRTHLSVQLEKQLVYRIGLTQHTSVQIEHLVCDCYDERGVPRMGHISSCKREKRLQSALI